MSDALLRASEASALTIADLQRQPDGSGRLTVAHSKTDPEGKGSTLYIGEPTMQRITDYLQAACLAEGPLFRRIRSGERVKALRAHTHQHLAHRAQPGGGRRAARPLQRA